MSNEMPEIFTYEDNMLRYEFRNNDFSKDLYKEFDYKATELGLNLKIDDLLSGKVVNLTENQAAFHPKYRKNKGFINEFLKSDTGFAPDRECLKNEALIYFMNEALNAESPISKKVFLRYGSEIIQQSTKNDQIIDRKLESFCVLPYC